MLKTNSVISLLILFAALFILGVFSCKREINPRCWGSCHEGKLYFSKYDIEKGKSDVSVFISNTNDTITVFGRVPKKFIKEGVSVCIEYVKNDDVYHALYQPPYVKLKCIQKK